MLFVGFVFWLVVVALVLVVRLIANTDSDQSNVETAGAMALIVATGGLVFAVLGWAANWLDRRLSRRG